MEEYLYRVTPFSAHCISDQKVRTVMVRTIVRVKVWVWVRVRLGNAVVRNAVGRKVGNPCIVVPGKARQTYRSESNRSNRTETLAIGDEV